MNRLILAANFVGLFPAQYLQKTTNAVINKIVECKELSIIKSRQYFQISCSTNHPCLSPPLQQFIRTSSHIVEDRRLILGCWFIEVELFVQATTRSLWLLLVFLEHLLRSVRAIKPSTGLNRLHGVIRGTGSGTRASSAHAAQSSYLLVEDLVDLELVYLVSVIIILVLVSRTLLTKYFESINRWDVRQWALLWIEVWVRFEQDVWEAQAEVGSINIQMLLPRHIHLLAPRTVSL